jgi:hypothetical protein
MTADASQDNVVAGLVNFDKPDELDELGHGVCRAASPQIALKSALNFLVDFR